MSPDAEKVVRRRLVEFFVFNSIYLKKKWFSLREKPCNIPKKTGFFNFISNFNNMSTIIRSQAKKDQRLTVMDKN